MKLEEVEQLTGLEGVKAEVEEVEEVNGASSGLGQSFLSFPHVPLKFDVLD